MAPNEHEVEVTVIGTGGGYGESVLIKVGIDHWIIIDSCINPQTKEPIAIEYLISIGVELKDVKLIVCTHWHNDHIQGLSKVLKQCPNAEFAFSSVTDLNKFLLLCELDIVKELKGSIASTNEFSECLNIINDRGSYFIRAQSNMILSNVTSHGVVFELFALTPSPKTVSDFDSEISTLITEFGTRNTAVIKKTPNDKSVALLLKFGSHRVVLGADLEIGNSDDEGWKFVLSQSKVTDANKAKLYKVPHHGSETSYISEIFDHLIDRKGTSKITPFHSSRLPKSEMLDIYSANSDAVYLTSRPTITTKPKKRDKAIEKIIDNFVIRLEEVRYTEGIIQSRINYLQSDANWSTKLFGGAIKH